jgi:phosphatidylserine decarboxylase
MKIAKGSMSWIISSFIAAVIFLVLYLIFFYDKISIVFLFISAVVFLKTIFFIMFFRDPDRKIGNGIVAAADGKIREISKINDKDIGDCICISTFMNIHNVHVNRLPLDGVIKSSKHYSGIHLPAFKKESEKNERVETIIDTKIGKIKIIQIAGTLARRIAPYVKKGDKLKKGDKIGIIKFGSRVDVYLPSNKIKKIKVKVGDRLKAGEDSLAEININD